jgi:iduronate 2-sulfatase
MRLVPENFSTTAFEPTHALTNSTRLQREGEWSPPRQTTAAPQPSRDPMRTIPTLFTALLLAPLAALQADDESKQKPNIVLLFADDLDTRLGCYGDPMARTPHMDRLAADGVRFDRAYCQLPSCGPSRASMLTGLYPWQTGLIRNDYRETFREKLPEVVTLPQWLRQHGYFSARVGKIYHMGIPGDIGRAGDDDPKSWDLAINNTGWDVRPDTEASIHRIAPEGGLGVTPSWLAGEAPEEEFSDAVGTREAIRILQEQHPAKTGKPLFLAMGYYRPHPPLVAPKKYFDFYPPAAINLPPVPAGDRDDIPLMAFEQTSPRFNFIRESDARHYTQARYAAVSFIDAQVGILLAAIRDQALEDNTIIILVGDQGFHLGEHGHWHKTTLFEEGCRVPLIITGPGSTARGQTYRLPVELVDVFPTLCDMLGLNMPHASPGQSLCPQLLDVTTPAAKTIALTFVRQGGYSLRSDRYRYTEWKGGDAGSELYDHTTDPHEWKNLAQATDQKAIAAQLSQQLRQAIDSKKVSGLNK